MSRLSKEAAAQRARAKDIIGRKDAELASINDETSRIVAAHQDLMDAVAQKMTDLGVPTAEPVVCSSLRPFLLPWQRWFRRAAGTGIATQRRQTVVQDQLPVHTQVPTPRVRRARGVARDRRVFALRRVPSQRGRRSFRLAFFTLRLVWGTPWGPCRRYFRHGPAQAS